MADKWMDDRSRDWRSRDWRDRDWRDREGRRAQTDGRSGEDRSWKDPDDDAYEDRSRQRLGYGPDERDYGERDYGVRSGVTSGGGAYSGGSYGRSRSQPYSTASSQGRYGEPTPRFTSQDYTGQDYTGRGHAEERYGSRPGYGRREAAGDRREDWESDAHRGDFARRESGREGGDFLQRAGERITSWFRGDDLMRGSREHEDERREAQPAGRGHRGVGPKGYQRSDERISDEVHDRLTEDSWLDASDIQVEVKGGEVTLSGHVENREAKHRAERLIEDLAGVSHVQNNLRVRPGAGLTTAGQGFGSSALEAEMRRNAGATDPGASDLSGRTSASTERSTGPKRN